MKVITLPRFHTKSNMLFYDPPNKAFARVTRLPTTFTMFLRSLLTLVDWLAKIFRKEDLNLYYMIVTLAACPF